VLDFYYPGKTSFFIDYGENTDINKNVGKQNHRFVSAALGFLFSYCRFPAFWIGRIWKKVCHLPGVRRMKNVQVGLEISRLV
jgi:hypothetical protein